MRRHGRQQTCSSPLQYRYLLLTSLPYYHSMAHGLWPQYTTTHTSGSNKFDCPQVRSGSCLVCFPRCSNTTTVLHKSIIIIIISRCLSSSTAITHHPSLLVLPDGRCDLLEEGFDAQLNHPRHILGLKDASDHNKLHLHRSLLLQQQDEWEQIAPLYNYGLAQHE